MVLGSGKTAGFVSYRFLVHTLGSNGERTAQCNVHNFPFLQLPHLIKLGIDYELTLNWAALVLQSWLRCGETALSCRYPFEILPRQKLDGKMNKSLIRTPLSSSEPGFDVPSQCAWSLSAKTWKCHRNISNCSKVLKEAKIHLKCSSRQTNISRESFLDICFTISFDGEES